MTQQKNAIVSIQKSTYSNLELNSLLTPFGGLKNHIKRGERVLLKVNLLNASIPNKAVTTNPAVVEEVAKEVLKIGGNPVIGDSPSGHFTKSRLERVYKKSGLTELEHKLGIELNYDTGYKKKPIINGNRLRRISICNFVLDADKIISLPKLKTHSYMIMTMATKIMFGVIPGLTKAKYHSIFIKKKSFAEMLLDILTFIPPDLIIMDGIVSMHRDGPSSGSPINLGIILASNNSIAIDLAVCYSLNIEPVGIPTLRQAKVKGLWPLEINYPILSPEDVSFNGFILPSTASYLISGKTQPIRSPVINKNCTKCGLCIEICPKNVIKILDNKVLINHEGCIKCYCCHEVCPENAIILKVLR